MCCCCICIRVCVCICICCWSGIHWNRGANGPGRRQRDRRRQSSIAISMSSTNWIWIWICIHRYHSNDLSINIIQQRALTCHHYSRRVQKGIAGGQHGTVGIVRVGILNHGLWCRHIHTDIGSIRVMMLAFWQSKSSSKLGSIH